MIRGLLSPILAVAALAQGYCQPVPEPGTTDLVSDSIGTQAMLAGGGLDTQPEDLDTEALGLGWTAADALPVVREHVADGRPETLVVALGVNDASLRHGGWTWADVAIWVDLFDAPHPDACVVVVLPAVGDGASTELTREVDKARHGIDALAGQREGPTVVVDWGAVIAIDQTLLADDDVHLARGDGPYGISTYAAEAATSLYWQGTAQCPS